MIGWFSDRKFASGHDNLAPVSEGFSDPRNGWGVTVVDAMDTMVRGSFVLSARPK
jgi:mannosyl-oligosaccharide alpha-1,2-mannosidase